LYRVRQKYLTILQNSFEWNRWHGEFVLERSYSETQSISVVMERWSVEHQAFAVETIFKNNDSVLTQDISSALQYSSKRVSLVAILLPLRISQEQGYEKKLRTTVDLKQNIREEVAAVSPNMLQGVMQNFQKRLGKCGDKGRHFTDTIFRK
jgi:primosomal protein N''